MDQIIQILKNLFKDNRNRYIAVIIVGVIMIALIIYFFNPFNVLPALKKIIQSSPDIKVIDDQPIIPQTEQVGFIDGRIIQKGDYDTFLFPNSEREAVVIVKAKLTVKGSYDLAVVKAREWSPDIKLIFIKSLGAIDLEGKSSGWQIVFGSKAKKSGYEIIVQADQVISQKEIKSDLFGYDLPENWYDSNEAIKSIQSLPQFSSATISAINFFYSNDAKQWRYGLATSIGNSSIPVK